MMPMPELEIIKELTELIQEEYPAFLLQAEEEILIPAHLPTLRYVGKKQETPPTMSGPMLLIELETVEPSIKDRVIRQTNYHVSLELKGVPEESVYFYIVVLKTMLEQKKYQIALIECLHGTIDLVVKKMN